VKTAKPVSLREIAKKTGVSAMTVSRALRGEPRVREALRRKIKRAAEKLGYAPDPRLGALFGHMRRRQAAPERETMTLLLPDSGAGELARFYYLQEIARGARARAAALGFRLELWSLRDQPGVPALERVLRARGRDLLVAAPFVRAPRGTLALHWERYAAAAIGPALWQPHLHRVAINYYVNMLRLLRQLKRLGYRRPALVCWHGVLELVLHLWEAAFRQFTPMLLGVRRPETLVWRAGTEGAAFRDWLRARAADVVISDSNEVVARLHGHGFAVPGEVGFATLTWNPGEPGISGFDSRVELLGAHAVDLVAEQFQHHQRGVPGDPKIVLHEGVWRAGATTKYLESRKPKAES
jgi:LacI family transcriptional regulator